MVQTGNIIRLKINICSQKYHDNYHVNNCYYDALKVLLFAQITRKKDEKIEFFMSNSFEAF